VHAAADRLLPCLGVASHAGGTHIVFEGKDDLQSLPTYFDGKAMWNNFNRRLKEAGREVGWW